MPTLRRETQLLALAGAFVLLATLALGLAPFARTKTWAVGSWNLGIGLWAVAWLACVLTAILALRRLLPDHDPYLLPLTFLLAGWGLALIWRLAPGFGLRQTVWLVVATLAMLVVAGLPGDLRWLRRYRYTWLLSGLALTAATLLFGVNPSGFGERLWLGCCGVYLQPVEILKLLLVVFLAAYLSEKSGLIFQGRLPTLSAFLPLLLMWGFSMVVLISQRDLGMSTLFFMVFLVMLYLASGRVTYVVIGLGLLLVGAVVGYGLFDVVRIRVEAWWNPWADSSGRSYQIVQSLIALSAGGLAGRGPGLGAPTLVPVSHSDFIFAALAEEWGLLGVIAAVGLLAALVFRGLHIAARAHGSFQQLLAAGLTTLMGIQALMIMGGVVKLAPLTGVTMPLMSYGGSSLVTQFVVIGLLLKLSSAEKRSVTLPALPHA
jgi:cell division protein FtsW (lipid II flippase)